MVQYALDLDIPDDVFAHQVMTQISEIMIDLIGWANVRITRLTEAMTYANRLVASCAGSLLFQRKSLSILWVLPAGHGKS